MNTTNNSQPHILLVEDDPAIAASLKITFKREGWQVSWLDNATAVLPMLQKNQLQKNQLPKNEGTYYNKLSKSAKVSINNPSFDRVIIAFAG